MAINTDAVQRLYVAYFNRAADPTGLAYWESQLPTTTVATQAQLLPIARSFSNSAEYANLYAGQNNTQIVNNLYLNLFGRAAEPAALVGANSWVQQLNAGTQTFATIALTLTFSAQGTDAAAILNKLVAANAFTAAVDTNAEIVGYSGYAAAASARTYLSTVNDTAASLAAAILPAAVNSAVAAAVTAGTSAAGTTFTLTTGIDTIAGGSNMVVNAADSAGASTWTGLDSITGTGTNNTFNISSGNAIAQPSGATVNGIQTVNAANSAGGITLVTTSGWSGLTQITTTESAAAATSVTAAATTNVSETATIAGAGLTVIGGNNVTVVGKGDAITVGFNTVAGGASPVGTITTTNTSSAGTTTFVYGGTNVNVSQTGVTTGNVIVGSATVAPTGTVTVSASAGTTATMGGIVTTGGTVVTVTETASNTAGAGFAPTMGAVTVNGTAATTTVSITQSAVATDAAAVTAVAGNVVTNVVAAAPGTQGVAAITANNAVAAVTAAVGVTANGVVTVADAKYNTTTANTITTVSLSSYGAGSAINDNALTTLSLSGTAGTLTITNATNGAGGTPTANSTLALTVNNLSGTNTITDANNEITTLNVTTGATKSTLAAFADAGLKTLTVAGSSVLTLSAINGSLTTLTVSGAAGFSDGSTTAAVGLAALGAALTITDTSSGAFSAALDDTTQTFVGSTGTDTIVISSLANATKTITAGSATNDQLILEGGQYALTAATAAKVTGFEQLGVAANVTGTIDVGVLGSTFNTLNTIGSGTIAFTNVANNIVVNTPVATTSTTVTYADTNGVSDTITLNLGNSTTTGAVAFGTFVAADANGVGIGTLNLVSNGVNIAGGGATASLNTLVTLTDNGLSRLNVSGTDSLAITTLNQATTQATAFTLNNTDTGALGVTIGTFTDANLGSLTFTGTGLSTITTLTDANASTLTIANTGTQVAQITGITSTGVLTNLTLTGQVQVGAGLVGDATGIITTATTGITINGSTDNQHVAVVSTGLAAAGKTDTITLGNGNNVVTDATVAGTVNVTVGTGSNALNIGSATITNTTGAFNITLGAHTATTGIDQITAGTGGTAYATVANYVITGAVTGDVLKFGADSNSLAVALTATSTTTATSIATAIGLIEAAAAGTADKVAYGVYNGNTYVAETISGTLAGNDTTIVQIVGTHTLTAAAGQVTLAS